MPTATAVSVRVLLVDDEPAVLAALARVLTPERGTLIVGALSSAGSLAQSVAALRPDVVLLDLDMPGRGAMEALRDLGGQSHPVRVVVLSGLLDPARVRGVLAGGAAGYIVKDDAPAAILDALPLLMAGGRYLSPTVVALCPDLGGDRPPPA